jgi:hypothetical protein
MSTESHTSHESAGGDGLLFGIAAAVVVVVAVEGLLIAFSSWWFMAGALLLVIAAAVGVSTALVRLMDEDKPPRSAEDTAAVGRPAAPHRVPATAPWSTA